MISQKVYEPKREIFRNCIFRLIELLAPVLAKLLHMTKFRLDRFWFLNKGKTQFNMI